MSGRSHATRPRAFFIPANPRDQNLCHHHRVLSSARPLGVAVRQGRCRAEDRRKPFSGGWSESGFPPVCKMAGRACEAHMRTGERYCDSSIFPGAAATSASPRIKRAPSSPQRNRSCHRRTLNGALEGVIYLTLSRHFPAPRPSQPNQQTHGGFPGVVIDR